MYCIGNGLRIQGRYVQRWRPLISLHDFDQIMNLSVRAFTLLISSSHTGSVPIKTGKVKYKESDQNQNRSDILQTQNAVRIRFYLPAFNTGFIKLSSGGNSVSSIRSPQEYLDVIIFLRLSPPIPPAFNCKLDLPGNRTRQTGFLLI